MFFDSLFSVLQLCARFDCNVTCSNKLYMYDLQINDVVSTQISPAMSCSCIPFTKNICIG